MLLYLAVAGKNATRDFPAVKAVKPYLPVTPADTRRWVSADSRACVYTFSVNPATNRPEAASIRTDAFLCYNGAPVPDNTAIVPEALNNFLAKRINERGGAFIRKLGGEFSLVYCDAFRLKAANTLGGSHPVYMTRDG